MTHSTGPALPAGAARNVVADPDSSDARRLLDACLATATGTAAGILVDTGFSVRVSIVNAVYRLLGPVFDVLRNFPNIQLVVAEFIERIPVVLIVGLLVGFFLRNFSYPRLLLCSVPVWFAYLVGSRVVSALLLVLDGGAGRLPAGFSQNQVIAYVALYSMQYALLILVIRATDSLLRQSARRRSAAMTCSARRRMRHTGYQFSRIQNNDKACEQGGRVDRCG